MKPVLTAAIFLLSLCLVGCYPEELIVWSPNGQQALVLTGQKTYRCDGDGKLTDLGVKAEAAAWFSDSRQVVMMAAEEVSSWEKLTSMIPAAESARLSSLAEGYRQELLQAKDVKNPYDDFPSVKELPVPDFSAMQLYLREHAPEALKEKLGDKWKSFQDAKSTVFGLIHAEIADGTYRQIGTIVRTRFQIVSIRPSPSGKVIAFTSKGYYGGDLEIATKLFVVETSGKTPPRIAAEACGGYFDWAKDGQSLVYCCTTANPAAKQVSLGTISQREICQASGELLEKLPEAQDKVGLLFTPLTGLHVTGDGKIIFTALEARLPGGSGDKGDKPAIYLWEPLRSWTVTSALQQSAQKDLPDTAYLLRVSPDGTRAAIPQAKGGVHIANFSDGSVSRLVDDGWGGQSPPTWRNSEELCLMVPPGSPMGSPKRAEVVLWSSPEKHRCISKDWPDEVIEALVKH